MMADTRRRKRVKSNDDSEELSEGSDNEQSRGKGSEIESEVEKITGPESEYESAEEDDTLHDKDVENISDLKEISASNLSTSEDNSPVKETERVDISEGFVDLKETSTSNSSTSADTSSEKETEVVDVPQDVIMQPSEASHVESCNALLQSSNVRPEESSVDSILLILSNITTESINDIKDLSEVKEDVQNCISEDIQNPINEDNSNTETVNLKSSAQTSDKIFKETDSVTLTSEVIDPIPQDVYCGVGQNIEDSEIMQLEVSDVTVKPEESLIELKHVHVDLPISEGILKLDLEHLESTSQPEIEESKIVDQFSELVIGMEDANNQEQKRHNSSEPEHTGDVTSVEEIELKHEEQSLLATEPILAEETSSDRPLEDTPLVYDDITVALESETNQDVDANEESVVSVLSSEKTVELAELPLEEAVLPDGTEESFSFCGGSTSGDLLDEEGGMEGAAEVDEECLFLEEDEEEADEEEEHEYVEGERQQGDGEESASPCPSKEKKLDDDEDRRNPQYIPKKGSFYEHDDRAGSEAEEEKEQKDKDKKKTKKLWSDDGRWGHDMYREEEQSPKPREELVSCYGYDIRSEDGPPRARRRRRYGRGPNKYTRNWQDEDAYFKGGHEGEKQELSPRSENMTPEDRNVKPPSRGRAGFRGSRNFRGGRSSQDLNLDAQNNEISEPKDDNTKNISSTESSSYATAVNNNKTSEPFLVAEEFPALPCKELPVELAPVSPETANPSESPASPAEAQVFRTLTFENSRFTGRSDNREGPRGRGRGRGNGLANQERPAPNNARARRGGNRGNYIRGPPTHPTETEDLYDLHAEIEKMKLQESNQNSQPPHRKEVYRDRLSNQNPELSSNQRSNEGRPKRYSSLRQRGVQEVSAYHPPITQTQQYYEPGFRGPLYNELPSNTQHQASPAPPVNPIMTSTFPGNFNPTAYQESYAMRAPMPSPPRLYHPPATLTQGQPVVTAPYMGDSMVPGGAIINYAPPPPQHPTAAYPAQFQLMQTYPGPPQPAPPPTAVVPQTHEMYTGGITYYSPHGQQFVSGGRALPLKRPKAAIPIVPPPDSREVYELYDARGHSSEDPSAGILEVES